MKSIAIASLIAITSSIPAALAESTFERELKQITEQRDKAIAGVSEPINRRYRETLEQLLRRATQASDLDAALKIKSQLLTVVPTATSAPPSATTQENPGSSKARLKAWLPNSTWTGTYNGKPTTFVFLDADKVRWAPGKEYSRDGTWEVTAAREITVSLPPPPTSKDKGTFRHDFTIDKEFTTLACEPSKITLKKAE